MAANESDDRNERSEEADDELSEEIVILLTGVNRAGDNIFNYLKLPLRNVEALMKEIDGGGSEVSEYGEVIAAGLGTPSVDIRRTVEAGYKVMSFRSKKRRF